MEQNEALPRSRQEKKEKEVKPTGFFTDHNCVIKDGDGVYADGDGVYAMKFTDGTTEYYLLTKDGVFFNDTEGMFWSLSDSFDSCYLIPSEVVFKRFPNKIIPIELSQEDVDEIKKGDGVVKLESIKKNEDGKFVFTQNKCIEAIEEKEEEAKRQAEEEEEKKRLAEEAKRRAEEEQRMAEEARKRQKKKQEDKQKKRRE